MFKTDNTINVLIGKDIASTASVQVTDAATAGTYIADGELTVLGANDGVLTASDTVVDSPKIKIVQGRGAATNGLKWSVDIDGANVLRATALSYRAPAEQVSFVGYDTVATAGNIEVLPYTDYKLTIIYKNDVEVFSEQLLKRAYYYTTGASDTGATVAAAFVALINGDEFYGPLAAVTNAGTDYGISLTGQPLDFVLGDFKYNKMSFDIQLSGFGTTPTTTPTVADKGSGTYEEVAELEWFANGEDGAINRVWHPAPAGTSDATSGVTYDVLAIESFDTSDMYAVSGTKPSRNLIYIMLPVGAGQATTLLAQLNPWLASANAPQATLAV
jgi:hypothetical protein